MIFFQGSPSIDEEFILKQFDIDSQSKPSYNVLHAVRPNPVPLELKKRMGLNKLQGPQFFQKLDYEQRLQKPQVIAKGEKIENQRKLNYMKIINVLEFWHYRRH